MSFKKLFYLFSNFCRYTKNISSLSLASLNSGALCASNHFYLSKYCAPLFSWYRYLSAFSKVSETESGRNVSLKKNHGQFKENNLNDDDIIVKCKRRYQQFLLCFWNYLCFDFMDKVSQNWSAPLGMLGWNTFWQNGELVHQPYLLFWCSSPIGKNAHWRCWIHDWL